MYSALDPLFSPAAFFCTIRFSNTLKTLKTFLQLGISSILGRLLGLRSAGFDTGSLRTEVRDFLNVLDIFSTDFDSKQFSTVYIFRRQVMERTTL